VGRALPTEDFTPVCTTELGYMELKPSSTSGRQIIGLSVDPSTLTRMGGRYQGDQGHAPNYPMIGDPELKVAKAWGMFPRADGPPRKVAHRPKIRRRKRLRRRSRQKIKLILVYR